MCVRMATWEHNNHDVGAFCLRDVLSLSSALRNQEGSVCLSNVLSVVNDNHMHCRRTATSDGGSGSTPTSVTASGASQCASPLALTSQSGGGRSKGSSSRRASGRAAAAACAPKLAMAVL